MTAEDRALLASIGRVLRRRRRALGVPVEVVAERSGCSPWLVETVELGRVEPTLLQLAGLARACRVPLADVLSEAQGEVPRRVPPALGDGRAVGLLEG